ncbi:MAG TPA: DUF6644 family protein [Vicinamibacterales bacterium]|nr:DUF6644 family protein [Vicinamibacterales bacterium]
MNIDAALAALEATRLANAIRNSLYFFPFLEAIHVLGLAMVVGSIAILDLRMLGIASTRRPVGRIALDVETWAWWAFGLTFVTGALMFITNAGVYYHNIFFRLKMLMLALAGLNVGVFELTARKTIQQWNENERAPLAGRMVATVSLVLWIAIIFMGRWIGFTTTRVTGSKPAPGVNIEDLLPK